ncbi:MAG: hypothetical protein J5956_12855 [Ruminococcus sp.]|nr:hypothetical protein [Ruminococcus sp.]
MKQRTFKKAAAGVLSLALLAGSLSVGSDVFGNDIKASAADARVATLKEASISLGGDMTYNFYLTVEGDDVSGLKAVIDGSHPLNGHKEYDLSTLTKETDGTYKVSFSTYATRMVKDLTLKIVNSDNEKIDLKNSSGADIDNDIFHYDLAQYRNAVVAYYDSHSQEDSDMAKRNMIKATYNYCVYSAKYFGNITEIPTGDNEPTELTRTIDNVPNWSVDNTKLTLNSVAFICDFETGLRYFFTTTNPEQDIQRAVYTYHDGSGAHEYEWKVVLRDASRNLYSVDVDNTTDSKYWDNPKKLSQMLDLKLVSDNNTEVGHIRLAPINVAKWCVDAANADNTEKPAEDCLNFGYAFANFAKAADNYKY